MFSPATTPEAMQAYPVWKNTIRQGKEGYIGKEERQLRSEVGAFIVAAAVAPAGTPEVFTKLLQDTLPYWHKYVDHAQRDGFEVWFMKKLFMGWGYVTENMSRLLSEFYAVNYQVPDERVWAKASRVDRYLQMGGPSGYITQDLYQRCFAVEDVKWFIEHPTNHYLPSVYRALDKGYTPQLMRKVGNKIYTRYSPSFASRMSQKVRPALLGNLAGLETPGRQTLTEELLEALVDAGFASQKEVREYAKKFGITWVDQNFYTRVVNAKKLYPRLADYVPVV